MKRLLSILLALALVCCLLPTVAFAAEAASGTCGENLTWTLADGVLTISGTGPMENYSVLIGTFAGWHEYNDEITSVIVEDGVTTIGEAAFHGCCMTSIVLPDSITSIGNWAFEFCSLLTSITIPKGVSTITNGTFVYSGLRNIVIPDNVTTIESYAFNDCRLESVTISGGVTHIGSMAFGQCFDLTEVTFLGDAPEMGSFEEDGYVFMPFTAVTATVYYPAGNDTWTEEAMNGCGGNLTWVPYGSADYEEVPGDMGGDGVVDDSDVAQLLWYTLFPEDYPISGNADFNGDGNVDDADVAYLLWHTLFPKDYPLT